MKHIITSLILGGLLTATSARAASTAPSYVAHEWGTFTSVQGSDGTLIHWNPFTQTDLPEFVYTRQNPCTLTAEERRKMRLMTLLTKSSSHWLQRMETPVIYFHSQEDFTVNVSVAFPKGLITEWYPAATAFGPSEGFAPLQPDKAKSHLTWNRLQVLGQSRKVTRVPPALAPSHYFTARTDSASPLRVQRGLHPSQAGEEERFLFYRGAGNFTTPLHAAINAAGELVLANRGDQPLGPLFVFRQVNGVAGLARVKGLSAGQQHTVGVGALQTAESVSTVQQSLAVDLQTALTETGLLADEAAAMVNTWRNDWLGDRGLRVLYLLPQAWTDTTLPLTLDPAPKNIVRVMVGRAEILEPAVEQRLQLALQAQLNGQHGPVMARDEALELRFLEAALSRVTQREIANRKAAIAVSGDESAQSQAARMLTAHVHEAADVVRKQWLEVNTVAPVPRTQPRKVAASQKGIGEPRSNR